MGEVYEAEDLQLRERVALKTVRAEIAERRAGARALQARDPARAPGHAPQRLPHLRRRLPPHRPAGGRERLAFLTMELLRGETLAEHLRAHGRLPPAEALPLVAADGRRRSPPPTHAGVVHRDFKSAQRHARAGARRAACARWSPTSAWPAAGGGRRRRRRVTGDRRHRRHARRTWRPSRSRAEAVTPAADLYALGVVLYEMVTGAAAVRGRHRRWRRRSSGCARRRPPPRARRPTSTRAGSAAILRCLERDPAGALRAPARLAAALARPAAAAAGKRWRSSSARRRSARWSALALGVGLAPRRARARRCAAGGRRSAAPRAARRSVAVLGFKNLSGRPEARLAADGARPRCSPPSSPPAATLRHDPGRERGARAGGSWRCADERELAPDTLARLRTGRSRPTTSWSARTWRSARTAAGRSASTSSCRTPRRGETAAGARPDRRRGGLRRAGRQDRRDSCARGCRSARCPRPSARAPAPRSPRADVARLYAEGLGHLRVAACSAARAPLEQAVATDPTFPLAHSALAEALACLGHDDRALAEAKKATELSANLPEQIRFATEAQLYVLSKQPEKASSATSSCSSVFPTTSTTATSWRSCSWACCARRSSSRRWRRCAACRRPPATTRASISSTRIRTSSPASSTRG